MLMWMADTYMEVLGYTDAQIGRWYGFSELDEADKYFQSKEHKKTILKRENKKEFQQVT